MQALSAIRRALGGSFERSQGIAQVTVYVAAVDGFVDHPQVANGASELLVEVLGEEGAHARAAVGIASLPLGLMRRGRGGREPDRLGLTAAVLRGNRRSPSRRVSPARSKYSRSGTANFRLVSSDWRKRTHGDPRRCAARTIASRSLDEVRA